MFYTLLPLLVGLNGAALGYNLHRLWDAYRRPSLNWELPE